MEEEHLVMFKKNRCPECGSKNIIKYNDTGEDVCSECGLVIAQKNYDKGPEWRAFDKEEKEIKSRVGAPLTYKIHDMGLTTSISPFVQDRYRRYLNQEQKAMFYRLRKWQARIRISERIERTLSLGLAYINKVSEDLNLPKNVIENASLIFRKAIKEGISRGRPIEDFAVGCVYLSCRQLKIPRSLDQISEVSRLSRKRIGRSYRYLLKELNYQLTPSSPLQYVSQSLNEFSCYGKTEEVTYKIILAAKQARLTSGKGPTGLAAASTYIASILTGERITQADLARKMRCTEVTIRNRYKELIENLMFIVEL
ncbi:MAG: transcription initiation factor IIB [Candidatus Aenigmarchaeota archaeon]|nr:transcription initiation factor IIB [Candidatus Aenigmarchaeota archaeon]